MANVELLQDYKGYTFKQKVIDDCQKILVENKMKILGYQPRPSETALVCVTSEKTKGEIKSIGGSEPHDLIGNNFGIWWAGMAGANNAIIVLRDSANGARNYKSRGTTFNPYNFALSMPFGSRIQVGSGTTAPARSDFFIESPFISAPESQGKATPNGGYNSGLGQVSVGATIGATGSSGTVAESMLSGIWVDVANIDRQILLFHDAISPTVSFISAQFINVNYIIQL